MLKRSIFTSTILCLSFVVYSQTNITVGRPYKVIDGQSKFYFYKDNELLTVKIDEELLYLQKFNTESLSYVSTSTSRIPVKGFEFIKEINDRHFMFYSGRGLFVKEINFKEGAFKDNGKNIISAKSIAGNATTTNLYGVSEKVSKYNVSFSNDESRMAIQYRLRPENKADSKSYETIGLHIFDNTFQELSSCTISMPYTEREMDDLAYTVDSKGNVYIVINVYVTPGAAKINSEEVKSHLEILKVTPPSTTITTIPINQNLKFINSIRLYEDPEGAISCVGFYNQEKTQANNDYLFKKEISNIDGLVLFKLNTNNTIEDLKSYEIPLKILNQYVDDKTKEKNIEKEKLGRAGFENLALRNIIFQKDGSKLIISEETEKTTQYHGGMNSNGISTSGGSSSKIVAYKDLLVTKIDSSGKISWMKRLPKGSVTEKISQSFYYLSGNDKEHYFLFLDDMKNFELSMNEMHSKGFGKGNILMAYSINDDTGKVKKTAILDIENVDGMNLHQFTTGRIEAIAPSVFLLEAYKEHGEDVLLKVDLSK